MQRAHTHLFQVDCHYIVALFLAQKSQHTILIQSQLSTTLHFLGIDSKILQCSREAISAPKGVLVVLLGGTWSWNWRQKFTSIACWQLTLPHPVFLQSVRIFLQTQLSCRPRAEVESEFAALGGIIQYLVEAVKLKIPEIYSRRNPKPETFASTRFQTSQPHAVVGCAKI